MDYLEKYTSNAQRRFSLEKKKNKCNNFYWIKYQEEDDFHSIKRIGKLSQTPKSCACWMCGNPRRFYKGRIKARISFNEFRKINSFDIAKYLKYDY